MLSNKLVMTFTQIGNEKSIKKCTKKVTAHCKNGLNSQGAYLWII